jgi:hypothetical protein
MEATQSNFDFSRLWDEKTAAQFLSVSVQFLQADRTRPAPRLTFIKLGRAVRYDPADVRAYASSCKRGLAAPQVQVAA